ncbi:MAG: D-alanyl-D-alanine carboxypeptidase family protein [Xanthobacteraceae bacterium]
MNRKISFRALLLGFALSSLAVSSVAVTAAAVTAVVSAAPAQAESLILVDAGSGKVLRADNATYPWHPASLTKLMTLYLTLTALRDGQVTPDTLFTVSPTAAIQSPTKMGFPAGTQVTVDNAIKMMMVKSANDMAVLLAEGLGGSIAQFSAEMTDTAHRLGMTETNYVNPNGLPDDNQITSARDLAILARALIHDFPQYSAYWHIPAIKYGRRIVRNYNPLLGRFPGADGMKTGFVCASGFNIVVTAERGNKRLIAVVLGASSSSARAIKAAEMLQYGFNQSPLSWLTPALGNVDSLAPIDAAPPDLTDEICGRHRHRAPSETDDPDADFDTSGGSADAGPKFSDILSALRAPGPGNLLLDQGPIIPVVVYTGPTRSPDQIAKLEAQIAAEPVHRKKRKVAVAKGEVKADTRGDDTSAAERKTAKPEEQKPLKPRARKPAVDGKKHAGKTAAARWTPMSSSALASSPPPEFNADPAGTPRSVAAAKKSSAANIPQ